MANAIQSFRVLERRAVFYTRALPKGVSITLRGRQDVDNVVHAGKMMEMLFDFKVFSAVCGFTTVVASGISWFASYR